MNRRGYLDLANRIYKTVPVAAKAVMEPKEMIRELQHFRIGRPADETYTIRNEDGFIYLNDAPAFRVCAKAPQDWSWIGNGRAESRILARQESDYD